jgi:hypothetical protein
VLPVFLSLLRVRYTLKDYRPVKAAKALTEYGQSRTIV